MPAKIWFVKTGLRERRETCREFPGKEWYRKIPPAPGPGFFIPVKTSGKTFEIIFPAKFYQKKIGTGSATDPGNRCRNFFNRFIEMVCSILGIVICPEYWNED